MAVFNCFYKNPVKLIFGGKDLYDLYVLRVSR